MTKESDDYELLAKELHEALLRKDGLTTIELQHNVKITGKSGAKHQIDVYWEFELAGTKYKTCIECKHFNSPVKKSHIAAFDGILRDIGNITGIYVTSTGYQSGALEFAEYTNIRLIKLNYLVNQINIRGHFTIPIVEFNSFEFDNDQIKQLMAEKNLNSYKFEEIIGEETYIYNSKGEVKHQLAEILAPLKKTPADNVIVTPEDSYILVEIGLFKIKEFAIKVQHTIETREYSVVSNMAKAIFEDVLANTKAYLNHDGSIITANN